jgi:hypothetical protein
MGDTIRSVRPADHNGAFDRPAVTRDDRAPALVPGAEMVQLQQQHCRLEGFLTTDLHRNKSSRDKLASDTHIAATVVEIFDRLVEVAGNGDDVALQRAFDRMRATVEEATRLYKEFMIAELALARGDAARLLSIAIS